MTPGEQRATGRGSIVLAGVTKRFGDTVAVKNIDLKIPAGSYCCLLGPSGCGKTTILRMIAGHESPTEGAVLIDGENVVGLPPVRRGTAMMFQSYALFPHLSCARQRRLQSQGAGHRQGRAARARAGDAGARAHEGVRRSVAGAALGRAAAAHRTRARAHHQPARAAARRAAVRSGRVSAPADARRAAAHPGRKSASRSST